MQFLPPNPPLPSSKLTDASLESIGANCRGLESLTLQGCEQFSDDGVLGLLRRCPNITALNLKGVSDLTEVGCHIDQPVFFSVVFVMPSVSVPHPAWCLIRVTP